MSEAKSARRILVLYHTQTGTVLRCVYRLLGNLLTDPATEIVYQFVQTAPSFPFPWPKRIFFAVPELALLDESLTVHPFGPAVTGKFDLIVIACPIWNISAAVPITSVFDSPWASVFSNTPVVSLMTCRSNYLGATERLAKRVEQAGGRFQGGIMVTDPRPLSATGRSLGNLLLKGARRTKVGKKFYDGTIPDELLPDLGQYTGALIAAADGADSSAVSAMLDGGIPVLSEAEQADQRDIARRLEAFGRKTRGSVGLIKAWHILAFVVSNMAEEMGWQKSENPGESKTG